MVVYPFDRKRFQADPVVAYFYRADLSKIEKIPVYRPLSFRFFRSSCVGFIPAAGRIVGKYFQFPDCDAVAPQTPLPSLLMSGGVSSGGHAVRRR